VTVSAWKSGSWYGPISGRQAPGATVWAQGAALPVGRDLLVASEEAKDQLGIL